MRDSSLSACTQAVIAAEVGHLELAYDYFGEAALMDLDDLEHNTRDGLHIGSLAGAWIGRRGRLRRHARPRRRARFTPRLPKQLTELRFGLVFRGRQLRVEFDAKRASYTLAAGDALQITHHGEQLTLTTAQPQTRTIPPATAQHPDPAAGTSTGPPAPRPLTRRRAD